MKADFRNTYLKRIRKRPKKPERIAKLPPKKIQEEGSFTPVSIRLPYEMREEFLELARERNQTLSHVIIEALSYVLEKGLYGD